MQKIVFSFSLVFLSAQAFCQSLSDTVAIRNVDVVAEKKNAIENFAKHFDSLSIAQYRADNLSSLLNESGGIFIKSFGAGSIATASSQGTSAYHTQVYWNGIAINNPMLGLSDLSLIPVNFVDEIFILNTADEKGNTSIGSSVHLNSNARFKNAVTSNVLLGAASFDNYKMHVNACVSTLTQNIFVKYFHAEGKNNFPFINTSLRGKPEVKQTNNEVMQDGFAADYFLKTKPNDLLTAHAWMQKTYRENPPSMTTGESAAWQEDFVGRFLIDYEIENEITNYKLQVAWLDEKINYVDSFINLESYGRAKTLVTDFITKIKPHPALSEGEGKKTLWNLFTLDLGIANSHYFVFADEYQTNCEQNRFAIFSKINFKNKRQTLFIGVSAREEILNNKTNPVDFSFDSKINLVRNLLFSANVATTQRQPTLNDFYWIPGGNPNLKPEKSFCQNAGLEYSFSKNKISLSVTVNTFNKNITNWIQWLPAASGNWEPQNVYKMWARGTEESLRFTVSGLRLKYVVSGNFSYTRSTRNESSNDELNDKQSIYVPVVTANGSTGIFYRGSGIMYSINYKDTRYTTSDNREFLNPYSLSRITAEQKIPASKKLDAVMRFTINNLLDEVYQAIAYRPMPGINYELTLQLNFKHNINKHKK